MEKRTRGPGIQGASWRRLDNTAKLFAAVAGEDLSSVFRISAVLKEEVRREILEEAVRVTLPQYENFRVKLRKGVFWYYFETNNREVPVEEENTFPCLYIDPHRSSRFPFRISYYGTRINFEVFHGLTDGLGALNFLKSLTENYLRLSQGENGETGTEAGPAEGRLPEKEERERQRGQAEDGYLRYYRRQKGIRHSGEKSLRVEGKLLPLDWQSVIHGSVEIGKLKSVCAREKVSITKYLTAALIWSLIQVYTDGKHLPHAAALNLPVNLRSFFESETLANFFSVVNIGWPSGRAPESFEEVLHAVSGQMDELIVKEKLEQVINCNVSREKKWYIRIIPLFLKHAALRVIFLRSSREHTMTFSNLGPVQLAPEYRDRVEEFHVIIGTSAKQRMKCGVIAYGDRLSLSFSSAVSDTRVQDFFFGFLEERGVPVIRESNGVSDPDHDRGRYPTVSCSREKIRKAVNLFYLFLAAAALVTVAVNWVTRHAGERWWCFLVIASLGYVAMTVRYSVMRRPSIAGVLVRQSLGLQVILILIDSFTGYSGWSVDFAIPSLLLFDVIAVVFLMAVHRMSWQIYFMYQIAITFFTFIPLLMWAVGWVRRPMLSVATVVTSVALLIFTGVFGRKQMLRELKRRFHL